MLRIVPCSQGDQPLINRVVAPSGTHVSKLGTSLPMPAMILTPLTIVHSSASGCPSVFARTSGVYYVRSDVASDIKRH